MDKDVKTIKTNIETPIAYDILLINELINDINKQLNDLEETYNKQHCDLTNLKLSLIHKKHYHIKAKNCVRLNKEVIND